MKQGNQEEVEVIEEIETPDLLGKTLEEAQKIAKESETELVIENETEEIDRQDVIVKEQVPKPGITIKKGSKIYVRYK